MQYLPNNQIDFYFILFNNYKFKLEKILLFINCFDKGLTN